MTEKQMKELRATLPQWKNGNPPTLTQEQAILEKELDIRDMMLSNLVYGSDYFQMTKASWYVNNRGSRGYDWDDLKALGVKRAYQRVQQIWAEMKRDFKKHATVRHNVYTDCEGVSYNSVTWDDEE